jgi:hypothetical protein
LEAALEAIEEAMDDFENGILPGTNYPMEVRATVTNRISATTLMIIGTDVRVDVTNAPANADVTVSVSVNFSFNPEYEYDVEVTVSTDAAGSGYAFYFIEINDVIDALIEAGYDVDDLTDVTVDATEGTASALDADGDVVNAEVETEVVGDATGGTEHVTAIYIIGITAPAGITPAEGADEDAILAYLASNRATVDVRISRTPGTDTNAVTWTLDDFNSAAGATNYFRWDMTPVAGRYLVYGLAPYGTLAVTNFHMTAEVAEARARLEALIEAAEALRDATEVSTDGADVSADELWVTNAVMQAFQAAINAATTSSQAVGIDRATLELLEEAYDILYDAMEDFDDARDYGTQQPGNVLDDAAAAVSLFLTNLADEDNTTVEWANAPAFVASVNDIVDEFTGVLAAFNLDVIYAESTNNITVNAANLANITVQTTLDMELELVGTIELSHAGQTRTITVGGIFFKANRFLSAA